MHEKCIQNLDGSLTIPPELVAKWEKQMETHYSQLSEVEKESDREQVYKYLPFIKIFISQQ